MIYRLTRPFRSFLNHRAIRYTFSNGDAYVPIRPLKQTRNVLFTIGQPTGTAKQIKLLVNVPFFGFLLEGLTSAWTWPLVGGTLFSFIFAISSLKFLKFYGSHEVFQLAVNKNLTKFQLVIPNNYQTIEWEDKILRTKGTTYQLMFRQKLKNGTLDIPQSKIRWLLKQSQDDLKSRIRSHRLTRKAINLEIDRNQVESIQMQSFIEIRQIIMDRYSNKKKTNFFQHYSTEKSPRDLMTIKTRDIQGKPLFFFMRVKRNEENKYDEYLKALAEGKTIVSI